MFAIGQGLMDDVPVEDIKSFELAMIESLRALPSAALQAIKDSRGAHRRDGRHADRRDQGVQAQLLVDDTGGGCGPVGPDTHARATEGHQKADQERRLDAEDHARPWRWWRPPSSRPPRTGWRRQGRTSQPPPPHGRHRRQRRRRVGLAAVRASARASGPCSSSSPATAACAARSTRTWSASPETPTPAKEAAGHTVRLFVGRQEGHQRPAVRRATRPSGPTPTSCSTSRRSKRPSSSSTSSRRPSSPTRSTRWS